MTECQEVATADVVMPLLDPEAPDGFIPAQELLSLGIFRRDLVRTACMRDLAGVALWVPNYAFIHTDLEDLKVTARLQLGERRRARFPGLT